MHKNNMPNHSDGLGDVTHANIDSRQTGASPVSVGGDSSLCIHKDKRALEKSKGKRIRGWKAQRVHIPRSVLLNALKTRSFTGSSMLEVRISTNVESSLF